MSLLTILQVLADVPPEEEATADTPWLAVILVLLIAFGVVAVVIGRLRKKASEIEELGVSPWIWPV